MHLKIGFRKNDNSTELKRPQDIRIILNKKLVNLSNDLFDSIDLTGYLANKDDDSAENLIFQFNDFDPERTYFLEFIYSLVQTKSLKLTLYKKKWR